MNNIRIEAFRYWTSAKGLLCAIFAAIEEYPLDSIDRFMLQTHINNLADDCRRIA